jgi:hypothetical protein
MQKDVFLDYDQNENNGGDMGGDSSHKKSQRNGLVWLPSNALPGEDRLSPFGRVAVGADRKSGRPPRYHEGMSLEDVMIVTGLTRDEVARRLRQLKASSDPNAFTEQYLSEGAAERHQAEQTSPSSPTSATPVAEAETRPEPAVMENSPSAEIIQFPLPFGEETRAVSNPLARCPLFAAVNERAYFKDWVLILETPTVRIEFSGEQLNQDEHDTFSQLLKMARHKPFGEEITTPVNAVLAGLERHTRQTQRKQLFQEIERLAKGALRITEKGQKSRIIHLLYEVSTPLLQTELPQHLRNITYRISPTLSNFFNLDLYTLYDQKERLKLGRSGLVKWLHFWIIGHAEQYPHKVETIRQKCGSQMKDLKAFRQQLRRALDVLKDAGVITGWNIDATDLVHIQRTPSAAQLEHLTKKAANTPKPPKE